MRYWAFYILGTLTPGSWEDHDPWTLNAGDGYGATFSGMEPGDIFLHYSIKDVDAGAKDGELMPGTELFSEVMALVLQGKALTQVLGEDTQ